MSDGAHKVKADIEKKIFRASKMTFGLVDVGYSFPFGQAVKLIFFTPCLVGCDRVVALIHSRA